MNIGEQGKLGNPCSVMFTMVQFGRNFKWRDGSHFFSLERRYGLMLNVDWFQPFKRRSDYSVGVIYFVVMNLPRSQRFKFENVIIGGIIPSLESEPKLNTFLEPCVDELNGLWKGILLFYQPFSCSTKNSCCSTLCCSRHSCNTQSMWFCRALCKQSMLTVV